LADHAPISVLDLAVLGAEHAKALPPEPRISSSVVLRMVEWTIGLNDQPMSQAEEVHDIWAERDLSTELQAFQSSVSK
jgi:hypothetical protein